MKDFILSNLVGIVCCVIALASFIVSCIKHPVKINDTIFEQALTMIPELISKAETLGIPGIEKKSFVVSTIVSYLAKMLGKELNEINYLYYERISKAIEDILSTPQKKGE